MTLDELQVLRRQRPNIAGLHAPTLPAAWARCPALRNRQAAWGPEIPVRLPRDRDGLPGMAGGAWGHAPPPPPAPPAPPRHRGCAAWHGRWLQDYIEKENRRLEAEQQFWAKEIVVKINYKYSPNLTIIDTPGAMGSWHWAAQPRTPGAMG